MNLPLQLTLAEYGIIKQNLFLKFCLSILQFTEAQSICVNTCDKKTRLNAIISEYDDMISRLCFGYCNSNDDFQDLRQDVYVNIYQSLERFREESSLKTWIYRITLNTCVSTIRSRKKEQNNIELSDYLDDNEISYEDKETIVNLYKAIERLNPIDKAIIMMWLDDISYDKISETLGIGRNTIATRFRRAKEKIKNMI